MTDELPEELDVTHYVGPYSFPDILRRRNPAIIDLVLAAATGAAYLKTHNSGMLAATVVLACIAAYHFACAWHLAVDETDALVRANRSVGFAVGHASAQLAWRGLRSRPVWRILLYSADDPPSMRGLVEVDAVDGEILGQYTEQNPEDWTDL
jgi:hypothetical protein